MAKPLQALLWALAIIFVALLASRETIDEGSATTLMIVMPVLASMHLGGKSSCGLFGGACGR